MPASISVEHLYSYHSMDREIFSRLVMTCMREVAESMLVMATWLWLEDQGFPNIIEKMVHLSDPIVDALADEAVSCLLSLELNFPPLPTAGGGMPLTSRAMGVEISLQRIYQNKYSAINGIKSFLNATCARIFTDLIQRVLGTASVVSLHQPIVIPGFPHSLFGAVTVMPRPIDHDAPPGGIWAWNPNNNVTENDRTMFLTFSRGFPVTEEEVRELFTSLYGNCVDHVRMQDNVNTDEQPLFARLVLRAIADVDQILSGKRIAKFRINGKHIWARKYERRD